MREALQSVARSKYKCYATRDSKNIDDIIDQVSVRQVFQTVTRSYYKVRRKKDFEKHRCHK